MKRTKSAYAFGIASYVFGIFFAVCVLTYSAVVFFLRIDPQLVPEFLYKYSHLLAFLRYSFITASIAAILSYALHLLAGKNDGKILAIAMLNIIISIAGMFFSPNVEAVFFFTAINGLMAAVFIEACCFFKYEHISSKMNRLSKRVLTVKLLAFSVAILFLLSIFTYYGYTRAVIYMTIKVKMTTFLSDALCFFLFMLSPTILILTTLLRLSIDVSVTKHRRSRRRKSHHSSVDYDETNEELRG